MSNPRLQIEMHFIFRGGNKNDRMVAALKSIGPAVFNGGISTLIAISVLSNSESHVFLSYFKVFL